MIDYILISAIEVLSEFKHLWQRETNYDGCCTSCLTVTVFILTKWEIDKIYS